MAKKQKRKAKSTGAVSSPTSAAPTGEEGTPESTNHAEGTGATSHEQGNALNISPGLRIAISCALVIHFGCLLLTVTSNFGPSLLAGDLLGWGTSYLVPTGQNYGATPIEWTHGERYEFPLRIEVSKSKSSEEDVTAFATESSDWKQLDLERYGQRFHNFSRYLGLIGEEDPESEMLAETVFQLLKNSPDATQYAERVRVSFQHVPTFDEQLAIQSGADEFLGETIAPEILFEALLVREDDQLVGLIPRLEPYRASPPKPPQAMDSPSRSAEPSNVEQ